MNEASRTDSSAAELGIGQFNIATMHWSSHKMHHQSTPQHVGIIS